MALLLARSRGLAGQSATGRDSLRVPCSHAAPAAHRARQLLAAPWVQTPRKPCVIQCRSGSTDNGINGGSSKPAGGGDGGKTDSTDSETPELSESEPGVERQEDASRPAEARPSISAAAASASNDTDGAAAGPDTGSSLLRPLSTYREVMHRLHLACLDICNAIVLWLTRSVTCVWRALVLPLAAGACCMVLRKERRFAGSLWCACRYRFRTNIRLPVHAEELAGAAHCSSVLARTRCVHEQSALDRCSSLLISRRTVAGYPRPCHETQVDFRRILDLSVWPSSGSDSDSLENATSTKRRQRDANGADDSAVLRGHPAAEALRRGGHPALGFGFSAGGLLFPYYIGVMYGLHDLGVITCASQTCATRALTPSQTGDNPSGCLGRYVQTRNTDFFMQLTMAHAASMVRCVQLRLALVVRLPGRSRRLATTVACPRRRSPTRAWCCATIADATAPVAASVTS